MGGHCGHNYNRSMHKTNAKCCEFKTSLVYIRKLCLKHNKKRSGETAQHTKVPATKPDNLISISRIHVVGGKNRLPQVVPPCGIPWWDNLKRV